MDSKEIVKLKFLELIEKRKDQTQRTISKSLNISLGNVNSIIKGLVETGCVDINVISKNQVQYVITKKGNIEKMRLAYEYLNFSLTFCCDLKDRIQRVFNDLRLQKVRDIVFFGAGELAKITFGILKQTPLELVAILDKNLAGQLFFEYRVLPPSELASINYDILLITELTGGQSVEQVINSLNIPKNKWATLFNTTFVKD